MRNEPNQSRKDVSIDVVRYAHHILGYYLSD